MTGSQWARTARVSITWREVRDFETAVASLREALLASLKADTPNYRAIVEMIENASAEQLAGIADNYVAAVTDLITEGETVSERTTAARSTSSRSQRSPFPHRLRGGDPRRCRSTR